MWNIPEPSSAKSPHPASFGRSAGATHLPESRPGCIRRSMPLHATALALAGFLHALPAQGVEFGEGEFQGSLDTTISHGLTFRVGKRDDTIAAKKFNSNDGELNYGRGLVSNTSKFTTDLDIGSGDFGAFVRATGFIDFENQNGRRERTPLSDEAKDQVGRDLEVLDAYVTGTFDVGTTIADVRLGKHVLNWGESTYIPNGINAINPFDVEQAAAAGLGASGGAAAGLDGVGVAGPVRQPLHGGLLSVQVGEDRDRPGRQLLLGDGLRRSGGEEGRGPSDR